MHGATLYWAGEDQAAGAWIAFRSVRLIDALEPAGIRPASSNPTLQIAGPYRWVRQPIYLGWICMAFGAGHMTVDRLAFAAISTAYLLVAVPWEERPLVRTFGDVYVNYARRVRWQVIPYVY